MSLIGKTFMSTKCGEYTVVGFSHRVNKNYFYRVRFANTSNTVVAEQRNIKNGKVGDPAYRNICGVAHKGNTAITDQELNRISFKRWYAMIERCYKPTSISYKSYGAKGVRVSDEWLCFDNFLADIQMLPGYSRREYLEGGIQLDKDAIKNGNKLYSRDLCCFISAKSNKHNQVSKAKPFVAISPKGEEYVFDYQQSCADKFGLTARTIGKALHGQLKTHKGWTFKYLSK